ncbi:MAG: hypothetical protein M3Q45_03780 [Chloroflexota bacterium]|nr:hypothetical protein [Chloroflexota bacterium]
MQRRRGCFTRLLLLTGVVASLTWGGALWTGLTNLTPQTLEQRVTRRTITWLVDMRRVRADNPDIVRATDSLFAWLWQRADTTERQVITRYLALVQTVEAPTDLVQLRLPALESDTRTLRPMLPLPPAQAVGR